MNDFLYKELESIPFLGSLGIKRYELDNGLSVAIVVDGTTPIFTYQTWYKVGSADEPAGRQGLAHLFEHMMFRQTARRAMGEFERVVNANGGTGINAYTSRDQTVYFFTFPSDKIDVATDLESDRMENLQIDEEMFATEKGAVVTEKNRGLDDPNRFLWEELYRLAYVEHNYRYSTIGEFESIKSFTADEARSFYRRYYSPDNSLIIVVGDVDPETVMRSIAKRYGPIPRSGTKRRAVKPEPLQTENREATISHPKATRRMLAKVWHTPSIVHADYPALAAVGRLLTSGKSAILNERILNTSKATELFADIFLSRDCSTFELFVQPVDGETFENIEKIVYQSLGELAEGRIDERQLLIVKNNLQRETYNAVTAPAQLARLVGEGFIYADDPSFRIRAMEKIMSVGKPDIERVVKKYIIDAKATTVKLLPEKGGDRNADSQ